MASVDFLDQLADYLDDQGLGHSQTDPVDIFVGLVPGDAPDDCIALLGLIGSTQPNKYIPEFIYPRFQVYVRSANYLDGADKLRQVREALHDKLAIELQNFYVLYIQAEQDGYPIGEDTMGLSEFTINFTAQIRHVDSV